VVFHTVLGACRQGAVYQVDLKGFKQMFQSAQPIGVALTAITVSTLLAPAASAATLVATELFLSVDASPSVSAFEFDLQKQGYVDAFRSAELQSLIASTPDGIAVNLHYWSGTQSPELGWHHLTDASTANAFADLIDGTVDPGSGVIGTGTNIAGAIASAANSLLANDFTGDRLVIDVSGDGTQNTRCTGGCVATLQAARDAAVADGIVINGLPIGGSSIATYYENNVIGGRAALVNQPMISPILRMQCC
jgi:hypothetical protein